MHYWKIPMYSEISKCKHSLMTEQLPGTWSFSYNFLFLHSIYLLLWPTLNLLWKSNSPKPLIHQIYFLNFWDSSHRLLQPAFVYFLTCSLDFKHWNPLSKISTTICMFYKHAVVMMLGNYSSISRLGGNWCLTLLSKSTACKQIRWSQQLGYSSA